MDASFAARAGARAARYHSTSSGTTGPAWHVGDLALPLLGAAAGAAAAWFGLVLLTRAATHPRMPAPGPRTMDLWPETPAVAEFLTGGWEVGGGAVAATLVDLAARGVLGFEQVGPDPRDTVIRLRATVPAPRTGGFGGPGGAVGGMAVPADADLRPYEKQVLHRVATLASNGVVPARALQQGTKEQDEGWRRGFDREVVAEARAAGLSRQRYSKRIKSLLVLAACVPAVLAAVAAGRSRANGDGVVAAAAVVFFACSAVVGRLNGDRETPAGQQACAAWLGVRDWIAADEQFRRLPPAAVAIWNRYLAYGAGFGITRTVLGALPFGARDERRAWSTYGGVWHEVRLGYRAATARRVRPPGKSVVLALRRIAACLVLLPEVVWALRHKAWYIDTPLAHGTDTKVFLVLGGTVATLLISFLLYSVDGGFTKGGVIALVFYLAMPGTALWVLSHHLHLKAFQVSPTFVGYASLAVSLFLGLTALWYLILLGGALAELALRDQIVGEIVRLRADDGDRHLALDPGGVTRVVAWPVSGGVYSGLEEGATVSVERGRWFGYVYSVEVTTPSSRGNLFAGA